MGTYSVINSRSDAVGAIVSSDCEYRTESAGDAMRIIESICREDPHAVVHIFGGDGSVFEAVNAVMRANAGENARLVIHPSGTGNDFARNFQTTIPRKIDLIRFNGRYAANEINLGFDCDVVVKTDKIKRIPFLKGSAAYMTSVLLTLLRPIGRDFEIIVCDEHERTETIKGRLLLCLFANGGYYGGGFNCAPLASLNDGYIEFVYADVIPRTKFLQFFLGYKKGEHMMPDGTVKPEYSDFLHYRRVKSAHIKNAGVLCADGEIFKCRDVDISILHNAVCVSVVPGDTAQKIRKTKAPG